MILIMALPDLQQLMIDYRFRPNRKFSQNFIINDSLVEQMVKEADLKKQKPLNSICLNQKEK